MGDVAGTPRVIRFGVFEVDLRSGELRKSGLRIRLQEQPFQILAMLLERPGEVVTREELEKKLWGADTFVDFEHGLATAVKKLREALGDSAENPRFVETLPRRGYRFIAPVDVGADLRVRPPEGAHMGAPLQPATLLRWRWLAIGVPSLVIITAAAALIYWLTRPLPPPRVLRTIQITTTGKVSPVVVGDSISNPHTATDGPRVYFVGNLGRLAYAPSTGGEPVSIPSPSEIHAPCIADISPDGSRLLVFETFTTDRGSFLWMIPVSGGAPYRVGNVSVSGATWYPDGERIVYGTEQGLFVAKTDGSDSRKLATVPGYATALHCSPDGKRLRFTLFEPKTNTIALWEVSPDGSNLHPLLPGWNSPPSECCGNWTPDGKYFVFQSSRTGTPQIWAMRENVGLWGRARREPVQLTPGPLPVGMPVPSKDGKRIYVVGGQEHPELLKYDSKSGQFLPYLSGVASTAVRFSRDGQWVAHRVALDGALWRSKLDGSQRLQLTFPPVQVFQWQWSPDGKQIAFTATEPGRPMKLYLVSAQGGNPRQLLPEGRNEMEVDWSPDGDALVFDRWPLGWPNVPIGSFTPEPLHILDLKTSQVSKVPGSDGFVFPNWSPNRRHLSAITGDRKRVMLFDFTTRKWTELAKGSVPEPFLYHPVWSRDGKDVYFSGHAEAGSPIYRVRISDRKLERVVNIGNLRGGGVTSYYFDCLAPDGSPLVPAAWGGADIYALEWEAP